MTPETRSRDDAGAAGDAESVSVQSVTHRREGGYLQLGSIAVDKASGEPLRVVGESALPAGEHNRIDVEDRRHWGVEKSSPVYRAVYVSTAGEDDNAYPPKKPYAFPAEQLFRYPVESALAPDSRRLHTQIVVETIAALLTVEWTDAPADVEPSMALPDAVAEAVIGAPIHAEVPTEVLLKEARELAEAVTGEGGESV